MKVQNIYIKLVLKPKDAFSKPCFETVYLGENVIKIALVKNSTKCFFRPIVYVR